MVRERNKIREERRGIMKIGFFRLGKISQFFPNVMK